MSTVKLIFGSIICIYHGVNESFDRLVILPCGNMFEIVIVCYNDIKRDVNLRL